MFTVTPQENKNCYASPAQREIIVKLMDHDIVQDNFFLSGGTALSVFYLHHRRSNDLDFFTFGPIDLAEIDFRLKTIWKNAYIKIKASPHFLSSLIENVKVDFVIDPFSGSENRERYYLDPHKFLVIDSIRNIFANKFCTIASRTEPKDFVDFYYLKTTLKIDSLAQVYDNARKKDTIFDDPPTVAFQIEQEAQFLQKNPDLFPQLLLAFDPDHFYRFYRETVDWIYRKFTNV